MRLDVVDDADVRVLQRRGEARLAREAREHGGVAGEPRGQELQRDVPLEVEVVGAVHHAHAAGAELRVDAIAGHDLADHRAITEPSMIAGPAASA